MCSQQNELETNWIQISSGLAHVKKVRTENIENKRGEVERFLRNCGLLTKIQSSQNLLTATFGDQAKQSLYSEHQSMNLAYEDILSKMGKKAYKREKRATSGAGRNSSSSQKRTQNIAKMIWYMRIQSDPASLSGWDSESDSGDYNAYRNKGLHIYMTPNDGKEKYERYICNLIIMLFVYM